MFDYGTLDEFLDEIEMEMRADPLLSFEILGVGFNGTAGTEVKSLSFDGNKYLFGTGCDALTPPVIKPTPPEKVETAA